MNTTPVNELVEAAKMAAINWVTELAQLTWDNSLPQYNDALRVKDRIKRKTWKVTPNSLRYTLDDLLRIERSVTLLANLPFPRPAVLQRKNTITQAALLLEQKKPGRKKALALPR